MHHSTATMAHNNRERSNMTRPKRVTIQEPFSDLKDSRRVRCTSSGTASNAASASEGGGGSNYGNDLGSLWKRASASIIGGLGISQEAMEDSSSQPSREEEEETETSWWTGFGGFTASSASTATSAEPTAKLLNEEMIKRSCHSRSGHRTLLLVEEAVEAFQDARLTPNKAAKVITRFLRHSASILKQVNLDIQFWEDELDCIDFDLSNELQDIQKSTEMRKKMIAMELEQEFKTSDSALDNHKDKVDQLSDEIAQEKLLHEKLKEHVKRLERENAQLAVLDPVLLEEMAQAEKQVRRLTRQTQQLTAVHDKYQTEHNETKRRLDMYQQARQDRRDQRKCCQRYIDRIIQMTQLKLGQEGHNLVRRIKHQKRENQLQQDALRASTSHKQPRRSSNDKHRPSDTAATLHSSTTSAKGDKMRISSPLASLKSSTDHKQRRSTTTRPRKPARRTQSFNGHESATSESGPDSTNRSLDEKEQQANAAKKKLERRCKSFNHSTAAASDVESGDNTNNMKRSSSSFIKKKKKKTTSSTSAADRCTSVGHSNKAAQNAIVNKKEIESSEACCDASFKSGESFHDDTKNFCDLVGVDDDEDCDISGKPRKQKVERRDGAVRFGGEDTNNFSDAVAIDDEEEQEEEHNDESNNEKRKARRGETRAATGDAQRRESASTMSWTPAPERPQDGNNLDASSCSPSMHQALLWIQSQDDSTMPKDRDTTTNRSSNNNHLAVRSPRSPQSVILETRKC